MEIQFALTAAVFALAAALALPCKWTVGLEDEIGQRDTHLDGLRGLAAIAVVACHVNQFTLRASGVSEFPAFAVHLGTLGVQMFFGLTAYLFTRRAFQGKIGTPDYYLSRVRRIIPLYLFVCIGAALYILWQTKNSSFPVSQTVAEFSKMLTYGFVGSKEVIVRDFSALDLIGITWTLRYEWMFYVLLPLFFAISSNSILGFVMASLALVVFAIKDFYQDGEAAWPFFLGGIIAACLEANRIQPPKLARIIAALSLLPLAAIALNLDLYYSPGQLVIVSLLFVCVHIARPHLLSLRPLRALGQISFSVYMLQYLVLDPIFRFAAPVAKAHGAGLAAQSMLGLAAVVILVPLSCLTYRFVERPWITSAQRGRQATVSLFARS